MAEISYTAHDVLLESEELAAVRTFGGFDIPVALNSLAVSMAYLLRDIITNLKNQFTLDESKTLLLALRDIPLYTNAPGKLAKDEIRSALLLGDAAELYQVDKVNLINKVLNLTLAELTALEFWSRGYWQGPGKEDTADNQFFEVYAGFAGREGTRIEGITIKQ